MSDDMIFPASEEIDKKFMQRALRLAEEAYDAGEVPIGAVIIDSRGQIIAKAFNQVEMLKDATAHAEILAITQAEAKLENWRLSTCTLYVTKEPCAMCAGAMINAKLGRLVFGCSDPRSGAAGSALDITGFSGMLWKVPVTSGVMGEESLELIRCFFRQRREEELVAKLMNGEG